MSGEVRYTIERVRGALRMPTHIVAKPYSNENRPPQSFHTTHSNTQTHTNTKHATAFGYAYATVGTT